MTDTERLQYLKDHHLSHVVNAAVSQAIVDRQLVAIRASGDEELVAMAEMMPAMARDAVAKALAAREGAAAEAATDG